MEEEKVEQKQDQSLTLGKLAEALSKAQGEMEGAKKESENPYFKQKYADLSSIWDACRKPLSQNGLSVVQTTDNENGKVIVITTLLHLSGEWIRGKLAVKLVKDDPQALGSAITYGRRYSLAAIVGISPEDDDAEKAISREIKEKPPLKEPQKTESELEKARKATHAKASQVDVSHDELKAYAKLKYQKESISDLTIEEWREIYDILSKEAKALKELVAKAIEKKMS